MPKDVRAAHASKSATQPKPTTNDEIARLLQISTAQPVAIGLVAAFALAGALAFAAGNHLSSGMAGASRRLAGLCGGIAKLVA